MSTLSSVLNSLATVSVNDFYKRFWKPSETESHYVRLSRRITTAWGILAIMTALAVGHIDPSVWMQSIKASGLLMGPMLGMFLLGMLTARSTPASAFWGCVIGVIGSLVAGFASPLEMFWLTLFGTSLTLIAGGVIFLLRPAIESERTVNRALTLRFFKTKRIGSTQEEVEQTV
jgi:Na+/proline symporter